MLFLEIFPAEMSVSTCKVLFIKIFSAVLWLMIENEKAPKYVSIQGLSESWKRHSLESYAVVNQNKLDQRALI
jgi:hypothetical protein